MYARFYFLVIASRESHEEFSETSTYKYNFRLLSLATR
jgi:hypothetical protein